MRLEQAELATEARGVGRLEVGGERVDGLFGLFDGGVLVLGEQRQERLRETREVPLGDARLVAESVAAHGIDGTEDRSRVIDVHEGAGAVVDGLARDRHVVGVHDAVNEADQQPTRDKLGLAGDHQIEEGAVAVRSVRRFGVVPRDDVIGEAPDRIHISARREELEGADADVARRDAGQYRAGQRRLAPNRLAGRHSGERSGRRDPKRRHRLADDVLAQDRPERRASVAPPGKRRWASPLELDVAAHAVAIDNLAEKNGTSVTELRYESSELVAGISHGERLASLGHPVARKDFDTLRCGKLPRIELEMPGELLVHPNETGRGDGSGLKPREESVRQAGVAVVECKEIDCFGLCRHDSSSAWRLRPARSTTSRAASCVDWRMTEGALIEGWNGRIGPAPDSPK